MASDEEAENVVVGVIERLIKRVEDFERTITERQAGFETSLVAQFTALRQDIYKSYLDLKVKHDDHEARHLINNQKAEREALEREHRKFTLNVIFAGLFLVLILGFVIIGMIILWTRL